MISRLAYVCCDRCGLPTDVDDMADDAREARSRARRRGFIRTRGPKPEDLCPRCAAGAAPTQPTN